MAKKQLTPEEIYKKNQKKAKLLKKVSPIVFVVLILLSFVCFYFAIKNSFGNIHEIIDMLNSKKFDGATLRSNYDYLTDKYGEWVIGNGSAGFQITFINIGHALFSGVMVVFFTLSVLFFVSAFVLKWLLPRIAEQITIENQDMVNLTILKNSDKK